MRTRADKERLEDLTLAPFAQRSSASAGRAHPEPPHPHRTAYERDRARVIHSRAFRRLEYETQVFLNGTGDHFRTRLTHTIEVASIGRTIAGALGLNGDLTEAIALAHDLGHSPFGHSGEEMLDSLMRAHGGFEHNLQSLRIVEKIEQPYPRFAGLNLSFEVLEGLRKNNRFYDPPNPAAGPYACPSLEAQIANLADEITYYSHDLDDGLDAQLIAPAQLETLAVWQQSCAEVRRHFPEISGRVLHRYIIRCIINRQVQDVVETSTAALAAARVQSADEVRHHPVPLIRYSRELLEANQALRAFLYANLYYHPRVASVNQRACQLLKDVFGEYLQRPELLGDSTALRIAEEGLPRAVCDYLSGMTDRYLIDAHGRLFPGGISFPIPAHP